LRFFVNKIDVTSAAPPQSTRLPGSANQAHRTWINGTVAMVVPYSMVELGPDLRYCVMLLATFCIANGTSGTVWSA
jgi:hypothetical protein